MIRFAVYALATGQILRSVSCREVDAPLQYDPEIHGIIEGDWQDNAHYIKQGEVKQIPPCLAEYLVFDYASEIWIDPRTEEERYDQADQVAKQERFTKLLACDWSQGLDVPEATRLLWQPYRQALRDITLQDEYPFAIVWPNSPM